MLDRLVQLFFRTRDDLGRLVPVAGSVPAFARPTTRDSRRVLWVPRNLWFRLIVAQAVLVVAVALGLNWSINTLTDALEASGVRSAAISKRTAFYGIVSVEALSFAAVVATILVFRPAWLLAKARQRVAAGVCGSCAYDLRPAEPDAGGLTRCPECGAAWDAARRRPSPREWIRGLDPNGPGARARPGAGEPRGSVAGGAADRR